MKIAFDVSLDIGMAGQFETESSISRYVYSTGKYLIAGIVASLRTGPPDGALEPANTVR